MLSVGDSITVGQVALGGASSALDLQNTGMQHFELNVSFSWVTSQVAQRQQMYYFALIRPSMNR